MKISYIIVFCLLLFSACNHTPNTGQTTTSTQDTLWVHHQYYRYGETVPFMDEYGRVIRSMQDDTSKLQYCKDSTVAFHNISQKYIRSQKEICYPHLSVFAKSQFIPEEKQILQQGFIKNKLISSQKLNEFQVHRTEVGYFQMVENKPKQTVRSNEYWSDALGLILKIDDNQAINRKRVIQLKSAVLSSGDSIPFQNILPKLYADSLEWKMK